MKLNFQKRRISVGLLLIVLTFLAAYFLQPYWARVEIETLREQIASLGTFSPLVFILLNVISVVISPIPGFPFYLAGLALYGFPLVGIYILIGDLIGASISFWIARIFGRPVVGKLIGKKSMKKVDEISHKIGGQMLLVFRLFWGSLFDLISYAAGLTSVDFKNYFLITLLGDIPPLFLSLYLFDKTINNLVLLGTVVWIAYFTMLIPLAILYYKRKSFASVK